MIPQNMSPAGQPPTSKLEHVVAHGAFSPDENREIFRANYEHPRHQMFVRLAEEFGLRDKIVCDAGCGYGANLAYCGPGSYGIDISDRAVTFCRSLGFAVHKHDIVEDDLSGLTRADVVWNSATIEHVDSPHIFLRKLHGLLKPGGLMFLEVPLTGSYRYGYVRFLPSPTKQSGDHINAFTPTTLRFFCERAGFVTQTVRRWSSKLQRLAPTLPVWAHQIVPLAPVADRILYIGTRPHTWEYPAKARRRVADTRKGFRTA
jgi:SAM-dependent methyltransferase